MVAPEQRFPLVRWAVLVCSFDEIGTQAHARRVTPTQSPGQKPDQQQGGGQKPGQQSQAPAKGDKKPKEPHDQRSDSDT
jgi:hypothetical protein